MTEAFGQCCTAWSSSILSWAACGLTGASLASAENCRIPNELERGDYPMLIAQHLKSFFVKHPQQHLSRLVGSYHSVDRQVWLQG